MRIVLVNQLTKYPPTSHAVLDRIAHTLELQLSLHLASLHQVDGVTAVVAETASPVYATDDAPLVLLDEEPDPEALGDHLVTAAGMPIGRVGVGTILTVGGGSWLGSVAADGTVPAGDVSVSATLSHEACEMRINPFAALFAAVPEAVTLSDGSSVAADLVAYESADPAQGDSYGMGGVAVSNFVGPAWFRSGPGQYDWLNLLKAPFTVRPGGYALIESAGNFRPVFGAAMPEWRRAQRSVRRHVMAKARAVRQRL